MKKVISILCIMLIFVTFSFAQDNQPSTGSWLSNNYILILSIVLGVYEVVARYIPTVINISAVSWIIKLIQYFVPNNKSTGGTHE